MAESRVEKIVKKITKRYEQQKGRRGTWETHWQQIADLMHPFDDNFVNKESPGTEKMQAIFDSTPILANQLLSSGLFSMMTSPAQRWYEYVPLDNRLKKDRTVRLWFDEVNDISFDQINRPEAFFSTAVHEAYLEYGAFGNCIVFPQENRFRDGLFFQAMALSESYLEEGNEGYINVLFRKYPRTVKQLVAKFGIDKVSGPVREFYESDKFQRMIKCIHAIFPSAECKELNQNYPFASLYIDCQHKHLMFEGHYFELPFMAARFFKAPHEQYGRGPGSLALPDIKMLNEIMRTTIRSAQKAVDPPLQAPDDGFLNPIRTTPGGINFYRAGFGERIEAMNFGSNPELGFDVVESVRNRIREIFYVDQLQLQEGPQMTATEVLQRTEEKLRLMGPLMGRIQAELLGPCLFRTFSILQRMNKFPPMPQILANQQFRISYTSPIARAQEQTEANGIMRAMSVLAPFIEMDAEIMDNFNKDELARGVSQMFSVSERYLNDGRAVAAVRDKRENERQRTMMAENMGKAGQGIDAMSRAATNLATLPGLQ